MSKDTLYQSRSIEGRPFVFNREVAAVFPDMIRRSVPGYERTLDVIGRLARRHLAPATRGYDLGCSLGAALLAMRHGAAPGVERLIGVDNSAPMIQRCRDIVTADTHPLPVQLVTADIRDTPIENASMVVLNYTLQFVPPEDRDTLLQRICRGMTDGGLLLLSEKIRFADDPVAAAVIGLHEDFKRDNAYTELEIARKRRSLDNVLVPDTLAELRQRLAAAGFAASGVWLQHYNFVSLLAFR